MADHIWIVRDPNGKALGASLRSEHSAVRDAIRYCVDDSSARLGVDKLEDVMLESWSETATGYEYNGYTLTREPLPARGAASEPVVDSGILSTGDNNGIAGRAAGGAELRRDVGRDAAGLAGEHYDSGRSAEVAGDRGDCGRGTARSFVAGVKGAEPKSAVQVLPVDAGQSEIANGKALAAKASEPVAFAVVGSAEPNRPLLMFERKADAESSAYGGGVIGYAVRPLVFGDTPHPSAAGVSEDDLKLLRSVCEYVAEERLVDLYQSGMIGRMSDQEAFTESVRGLPDRLTAARSKQTPSTAGVSGLPHPADRIANWQARPEDDAAIRDLAERNWSLGALLHDVDMLSMEMASAVVVQVTEAMERLRHAARLHDDTVTVDRCDLMAVVGNATPSAARSEEVVPPQPAFTVEISVGACDWNRLTTELVRAAEHVQEHGASCNRVWGGAGTHGHVHITRRDVTQEQYNAELMAWHTSGRAAREVRP